MAMCNSPKNQTQLTKSLEKLFSEAQLTGELNLSGRKLRDFPKICARYDLSDTVYGDLSRNRFTEFPDHLTDFHLLERLDLYENVIKYVPDSVIKMESLSHLNLSRNQLPYIPAVLCQLPLQILILSNNRLVSLPEEIGSLQNLQQLDVSCNEIAHLPCQIGELAELKSLNMRRNLIIELPQEIASLKLIHLDISENRISLLPSGMKNMTSIISLVVKDNPLSDPPAFLCSRGLVHIFKFLEIQSIREERKRGFSGDECRKNKKLPLYEFKDIELSLDGTRRRSTVDSGYGNSEMSDKRWSHSSQGSDYETSRRLTLQAAQRSKEQRFSRLEDLNYSGRANGNHSSCPSTPSTLSPDPEGDFRKEWTYPTNLVRHVDHGGEYISHTNYQNGDEYVDPDNVKWTNVQTYREYKEAQKASRNRDGLYKIIPKSSVMEHQGHHIDMSRVPRPAPTGSEEIFPPGEGDNGCKVNGSTYSCAEDERIRNKMVQKEAVLTYVKSKSRGDISPTSTQVFKVPSPPVEKPATMYDHGDYNGLSSSRQSVIALANSPFSTVNANIAKFNAGLGDYHSRVLLTNQNEYPNFTMKREFEKAKEEHEMIEELRKSIESRLKVSLPEDLPSALTDGVVLCHLANHVRPRSVSSIHVPSPAVPKLSMAKCRRNVENFIEACRRLGVREAELCSTGDVLGGTSAHLIKVACTVRSIFVTRPHTTPLPPIYHLLVNLLCLGTFFGTCILLFMIQAKS